MGGFFLSLGGARSYPPPGRKTPDTARAFFGLCGPRRKESPSASLSRARIPKRSSGPFRGPRRAGGAACRDGRSFDSLPPRGRGTACGGRSFSSLSFLLRSPFLFPLLQSPCGRQLPRGGSLSGRGTACGGRNPRCLPLEGGGSRSETEGVSPRCLFSFLP